MPFWFWVVFVILICILTFLILTSKKYSIFGGGELDRKFRAMPTIKRDDFKKIIWKDSFNYPLDTKEEVEFQKWFAAEKLRVKEIDPDRDLDKEFEDYDWRANWKYNKGTFYENGHYSDIGKKPNHNTFSDESYWDKVMISPKEQAIGGHWTKKDVFIFRPSEYLLNREGGASQWLNSFYYNMDGENFIDLSGFFNT